MSISTLFANPPKKQYQKVEAESQYLTMQDGTHIAIDVMKPAGLSPEARIPTVMIMARYWRSFEMRVPDRPNKAFIGAREPIADDLLAWGFAVVVVDGRGTGASTGVSLYPWSTQELADHGEVARWVTAQNWSNGNIGAVGISYEGSTAQYLLGAGVEGVKSAAPMEYEFDVYTDVALPGGIFNKSFIEQWNESNQRLDNNKTSSLFPTFARFLIKGVRPISREKLTQAIADHQANTNVYEAISNITYRDDPFGNTGVTLDDFSVFSRKSPIEANGGALFIWGSWLDGTTADTVLRSYNTLANPTIGIIGAWKHELTAHGSPYLAPKSPANPPQAQQWEAVAQFFERTLSDNPQPIERTLFYYTLGEEKWKQTSTFPLPNTQLETWYFQAENSLANSIPAQAGENRYTVDFEASTGKTNRWQTQMARPVVYENRAKADQRLLTYTSAPLMRDVEITGYPVVTLYVESTQADSALFVYLEDVDEQGFVRYITEGQLRTIHHKLSNHTPPYWSGMPYRSFAREDGAPLPINTATTITFGLQPTSVLIRKGHQIRVAIGGADKYTFAPISATHPPQYKILYGGEQASFIQLPIIPR